LGELGGNGRLIRDVVPRVPRPLWLAGWELNRDVDVAALLEESLERDIGGAVGEVGECSGGVEVRDGLDEPRVRKRLPHVELVCRKSVEVGQAKHNVFGSLTLHRIDGPGGMFGQERLSATPTRLAKNGWAAATHTAAEQRWQDSDGEKYGKTG
jgi:hypothetical protein